ncbi:sister chromatid cohesion protein PDS5 homolog C isoform X2 [Daucus carota subsp. sativus]|uniref:sister chromatid cohesion protein PDS5 homolog C isoform X2 n=1 Tax=Daucus carota subsp. sativus TaxID=79200 RepID=UPI0030831834
MEKQLVERLRDAGNRLHHFPSQVDQLLSLLDQVENLLEKVDQSPSTQIQNAYSKITKALLAEPLIRHADADVQVSVASCISEITRITAPEAPYDDDKMKEVFQLIVSSFADLYDMSSRSYDKRASILETVAKIRSCVVMLDLECDGLIIEMFKHFLRSIRDDHPKNIFESMETIMTVVLEESEDVSVELLMPILAILKRGNEENSSVACKLGESVFAKCAVKLKPFLKQAVKSSGLSLEDYSQIVTTICNGSNGEVVHEEGNIVAEQLVEESRMTTSSDGMPQDAKELVPEHACEEVPLKHDDNSLSTEPLNTNINKEDKDDIDTVNLGEVDNKQERTEKKRGRKPCSPKPSEPSRIGCDIETEIICQKASDKANSSPSHNQDVPISLDKDARASPDKEELPFSPPEMLDSKVKVSLSPSKSLSKESSRKKVGVSKEKDTLAQELASVDSALKKAIDGTSSTEGKLDSALKKVIDGTSSTEGKLKTNVEKKKLSLALEDALSMDSAPEEAAEVNSDSEIKPQKQSGKRENFVQEHQSGNNLFSDTAATADGGSDLDIEAKGLPRKNGGDSDQEDEHPEGLISPSGGSNDSEKVSGKKKVNLAQEDEEPVSQKVDDKIRDFKRSGKKAIRTKKATSRVKKGNMLKRRGTSKTDTKDDSDKEEELALSASEGDERDSEAKPLVQSGKEVTSGRRGRPPKKSIKVIVSETDEDGSDSDTKVSLHSDKEKTSKPVGQSLKNSGKGNVSEAKLPGKKENKTNMDKDSRKKDATKRTVLDKNKQEKILSQSQTKGMVTSPKSTRKPLIENDPRENSKRKLTPGDYKGSGDIEYGENLVGARVKVWWPDDKQYYEGIIESFDVRRKKHKVSYTDGDEEVLVLQKEKWEFVDDGTVQEEGDKDSNPSSSAKSWKRARRNPEQLEQKQMDVSPQRGGTAATNKLKGTATKSSQKHDAKAKDKTFKITASSEEDEESEDDSMDRTHQSGNTSSGTRKVKSSLSKLKESNTSKGKSSGSSKTPETAKAKSAGTPKAGKSGGRSGKKRRRGY